MGDDLSVCLCWVVLTLHSSLLPGASHPITATGILLSLWPPPRTWVPLCNTCYCDAASLCLCPSLQVSVLTGIIKISLKTLLECVRLRTFGRYGLQQVQVDCHFLQLYLWRFVADEELVHLLLDEVVASAALRCPDPVPMEPSVVEVICERG